MEALKILERAVRDGYLLHGSRYRLDFIELRQANDKDKVSGNQFAVYATDNVRVSILHALFHPIKPEDWMSGYDSKEDGVLRVYGKNVTFEPGYVYFLPSATFSRSEEDEFVSLHPVRPTKVITVSPEIVSCLNLQVEFSW